MYYTEEELLEAVNILVEDYGIDEDEAIDMIAEAYEMELLDEGESHTAAEWAEIERQRKAAQREIDRGKEKQALLVLGGALATTALYNHAMKSKKLSKKEKRALGEELKRKRRKAKVMMIHKLR